MTPPIPPPLPRAQTNSMLSFQAGQHDRRRIAADEAARATQIRHGARRLQIVQSAESAELAALKAALPPDDAVTTRIPRVLVQPEYPPPEGGCTRCKHLFRVHQAGKDRDIPCTSAGCPCPRFREGWTPWRIWAFAAMTVFWLIVVAVVVGMVVVTLAARHG